LRPSTWNRRWCHCHPEAGRNVLGTVRRYYGDCRSIGGTAHVSRD
jgi:hypothetical protein